MNKNYNWDKPSGRRRFSRDMAKLAELKAESIKKEIESSYVFPQRQNTNFPYSPISEKHIRKIMCPNCLKIIGVATESTECPLCGCQIKVNKNTNFLQ